MAVAAEAPERDPGASAAPSRVRVLVVDDEPAMLRALRINLRVRKYDVTTAATGQEALTEAGVLVGLPRATAAALVTQTLLGSATLLAETGDTESPAARKLQKLALSAAASAPLTSNQWASLKLSLLPSFDARKRNFAAAQ